MIPKGTVLYPESQDWHQLYYNGEPYAYWQHFLGLWILYKEYNDYISECHPNDCISAYTYDEVIQFIKDYTSYKDKEGLCRTFRQRSLKDNEYNFEDFIHEF